jgi:hypothetical protein
VTGKAARATLNANDDVLNPEQRVILQAIYDRFRQNGKWPTFLTVDRPLRRGHGMNTRVVFNSLPESFVLHPRQGMGPADSDELKLRLAGIELCDGGGEDTEQFVHMLRWFAEQELAYTPPVGEEEQMPRVTSEEVAAYLGLDRTDPEYRLVLERLLAMTHLDNWGLAGSGSNQDEWYVNLGPEVWRFRDVQTAEDVVKAREDWVNEAQAAAPHFRSVTEEPDEYEMAAPPSFSAAAYIDKTLIAAIRSKDAISRLDCTKLLTLCQELNDNHAQENAYAAHALLRAILDHIPPILDCKSFAEVANNHSWTQTDKKYVKKLLDFKLQGDDALHRQISERTDLIEMEDLPPRTWLNRLLQECADKL